MSTGTAVAPDSPLARVRAVVDAFARLGDDEECTFHEGKAEGQPAVVVKIGGTPYGLLAVEARRLADIMERALVACDPEEDLVRHFIRGLRTAANKADPIEPKVEYGPEVQAAIAQDPELAEAVRSFAANVRQAMADVASGKYASFDDAIFALTGNRPEPLDLSKMPGLKPKGPIQ